jgi:superfamily II DNA or RNA helicase
MEIITLTKLNEAFVKFDCERGVAQEIWDFFSFYVPGFQYMPAFRKKFWDGKLHLANLQTRTLPGGLVGYLKTFADERQYKLVIDEALLLTTNFSLLEAQTFADSLKLPHVPRDYQIEAFAKSIRNKRLLVVSPTASGKSLIIYLIVRYLHLTHLRGVVIVPTTSLVEQLFGDFKDYGWDSDRYVHRIYSGKEKYTEHFLTISTWQSLHRQGPDYLKQFDFVIGDEAHQFKAKSLTDIMGNLTKADVRIGTTGTLDGAKVHKLVLEGHFGPVTQPVTTKELMTSGHLANLDIKCLVLKYPKEICAQLRKSSYPEEYEAVVQHPGRAKFIRNLALSLKGNTLILFQLVKKHGKPLYEDIAALAATGRPVFFVHGGVETEDREDIRKITEVSEDAIVVASYGTFSTGINIKNLHNVIFAAPSKSKIRNLQSIGRGLRTTDSKTKATLFDVVDDLRIGKHQNFLLKHFTIRTQIYHDEKFPFQQYLIELKGTHAATVQ